MLKRIVDALVALVAPLTPADTSAIEPDTEPTTPEVSAEMVRAKQETAFASQLDLMAKGGGSQPSPVVAGSLELVGLEDVREAMGDRWQALGSRAEEIAEAELRLQLDDTDFYRPYGNTSFLVCFSNLDKPAADGKARQIAARIKAQLVQQIPEIAQTISVDHFVAAVDRATLRQGNLPIADRLLGTLEKMREEVQATTRRFRVSLLRDFQILYSPAWHTAKRLVVLNRCLLDMASGYTTLAQFQALADPLQLSQTLAELDFSLLSKSLEALHHMLRYKRGSAILVPVAFQTIGTSGTRREYMRLLSQIPDTYRKYVIIEINGIPKTVHADRLGEMITILTPFAKGLALEVSVDDPRLEAFLGQNPWALSVNLQGANGSDPHLAERLRKFVSVVTAARTPTFAHGVNSIGLALAALEAGFGYLDGPAIHPLTREPKPLSPLNPLPTTGAKSMIPKRWEGTNARMVN